MVRNKVRLTESQFRRVIRESVCRILEGRRSLEPYIEYIADYDTEMPDESQTIEDKLTSEQLSPIIKKLIVDAGCSRLETMALIYHLGLFGEQPHEFSKDDNDFWMEKCGTSSRNMYVRYKSAIDEIRRHDYEDFFSRV